MLTCPHAHVAVMLTYMFLHLDTHAQYTHALIHVFTITHILTFTHTLICMFLYIQTITRTYIQAYTSKPSPESCSDEPHLWSVRKGQTC